MFELQFGCNGAAQYHVMSSAHPVCNSHGICKPLLSGRKASSCPPACPLLNRRARRRTPPFQSLHAACKAGGVGNGSTTRQEDQALVIGAGIAGLSCGLRLHKAGIPFSILEASDGVGGRVRSDRLQGFTLDRGFQIFLTSYPEAKAALDYTELDLKPFYAGALVHYNKKFHKVADPLRHPLDGALSLFSTDTGSVKDKVTVGAVRLKSQVGSVDRILQRNETTTLDRLKV